MQGILVVGHGSRSSHASEVLESVGKALSSTYPKVAVASMQFNRPTIAEAVGGLVAEGASEIVIAPFFLYAGNHVMLDIPEELTELEELHPGVCFRITDALGYDDRLLSVFRDRIDETLAGNGTRPAAAAPHAIEERSLEIVRGLISGEVSADGIDFEIIQRIVHTTGDPGLAKDVIVSPGAADSGLAALRRGAPVIVDVTMVRSGIHRNRLAELGCEVLCRIDDEVVAGAARETGKTRAATAIRVLREHMDGAVVAIGNAPTALFEMMDIMSEGVTPALIVGTPVGFVGAAESKAALVKESSAPFVTVSGTRGGSPVAAAVVNALIKRS